MTKNTLKITLTCNGRTLAMGPGEDLDITKVSGLESSDIEISSSENALIDGETIDGKKIKARPIHIEAKVKSLRNNPEFRAAIIKFFNPKYTGKILCENMGTSRNIEYELEGWTFATQNNWDARLGISVDLICPDPYWQNVDNFGQNMAGKTALFAFPWFVLPTRATNKLDYPEKARGLMLSGMTMAYRTLREQAVLSNDGDVPTGVIIKFTASRGTVSNPKILNTVTGEYMRVVVDMAQGDVLTVDTNERHQIIELNGVNYYQHIDRGSEPFLLAVGDNYLQYSADTNYVNLDVNLYYTPKYLGV